MRETAAYIRGCGLDIGLYTTSGNYTCAGEQNDGGVRQRGSGGFQREDVELWIREWGVTCMCMFVCVRVHVRVRVCVYMCVFPCVRV